MPDELNASSDNRQSIESNHESNQESNHDWTEEWYREWAGVELSIRKFCHRSLNSAEDAEDAFQRTAVRAWKNYPRFRRDSAFATWVFRIAHNEIRRTYTRREIETLSLTGIQDTIPDDETPMPSTPLGFNAGVQEAVEAEVISQLEATVIRLRADDPDNTWPAIEKALQIKHGAKIHMRAMPRLRVFFFVRHPLLLGGMEAISLAFAQASRAKVDPLTAAEQRLFAEYVLKQQGNHRAVFRAEELRSACTKVARFLSLPFA